MKTNKENINQELKELNADFLLSLNKEEVEVPFSFQKNLLDYIDKNKNEAKTVSIKKMLLYTSGIAASLIIGIFIFSTFHENTKISIPSFAEVSEDEILLYIEDNITNYTEEELIALVDIDDSENFFDNSGITNEYLEDYFINQLNEEIQLEDLL